MENGIQWAILHTEKITDVLQTYLLTPKGKYRLEYLDVESKILIGFSIFSL